jgi:putative Holliday junction resolvase
MRLLGIDHGTRRIGIAVADTETRMAFARPALRASGDVAVRAIAGLARAEDAGTVVVVQQLIMDGSEVRQAFAARSFGERLAGIGLRVVYVDERLTSFDAERRLAEAGRRPSRRSGELDSAAATVILQQYLDSMESL